MRARSALVTDIIEFSWVDGPGNRFVVFLQGCDFDCKACHNPHTIPLASTKATTMTVDDVLARLRDTMPFVSGLTVSGGEATLQWQFVRDLFAAVRASEDLSGLSTMVDSNGNADEAVWRELAPVMDGAMVDLKALDPQTHRELTGKSNEPVLKSIRFLAEVNRLAEVRLLLIPGRNDSDEELTRTAHWLTGIDPNIPVRLNLFMTHGVRMPARSWQPADPGDRSRYESVLQDAGVRIVSAT